MAKKKTKPMTTDDFRQMERQVGEAASANAKDCWRQQAEEAAEKTRRRALANRTMRQIVEAMMAPPEAVMIPTDFAAAWASDRASFLKLIKRPLTAEETAGVAGAMAVLMEHNRRLRLLAKDLLGRLEAVSESVSGFAMNAQAVMKKAREASLAGEDYIDVEDD